MDDFNFQYFGFARPREAKLPDLVSDENTRNRNFRTEPQHPGSAPLVFVNGLPLIRKIQKPSITPDVLFSGHDILVRTEARNKLLHHDIANVHLHPAIYIDDNKEWHEDFWFLTFTTYLDCWDREASEYDRNRKPISTDPPLYDIDKFSLDAKVLSKIPLRERLLFKMGGSIEGFIVCHSSIRSIFAQNGRPGISIMPINEFSI